MPGAPFESIEPRRGNQGDRPSLEPSDHPTSESSWHATNLPYPLRTCRPTNPKDNGCFSTLPVRRRPASFPSSSRIQWVMYWSSPLTAELADTTRVESTEPSLPKTFTISLSSAVGPAGLGARPCTALRRDFGTVLIETASDRRSGRPEVHESRTTSASPNGVSGASVWPIVGEAPGRPSFGAEVITARDVTGLVKLHVGSAAPTSTSSTTVQHGRRSHSVILGDGSRVPGSAGRGVLERPRGSRYGCSYVGRGVYYGSASVTEAATECSERGCVHSRRRQFGRVKLRSIISKTELGPSPCLIRGQRRWRSLDVATT